METAFLGLGSNLGDRENMFRGAMRLLDSVKGIRIEKISPLYETDPVGGPPDQPLYLNSVLKVHTELLPRDLLFRCLKIEKFFGRERQEMWGPRTLDLDILFWGTIVFQTSILTIPHPRLHERAFVLMPLADIAPDWVHPVQKKTIRQLCAALKDVSGVRRLERDW